MTLRQFASGIETVPATTTAAVLGEFSLSDLERACLGVSRDMIRQVLRDLQKAKAVHLLGAWSRSHLAERVYYP
jgi:hypothetical protein